MGVKFFELVFEDELRFCVLDIFLHLFDLPMRYPSEHGCIDCLVNEIAFDFLRGGLDLQLL